MSARLRLCALAGAVALLHAVGWGLYLWYARHTPALAGLGTLASAFGLRHAFDADHIAAIDNTTRKLLQDGKRPLGVGFFFSLGHSTIVFLFPAGLALAAKTVQRNRPASALGIQAKTNNPKIPAFQDYGSYIGASISGTFLIVIGLLNLIVLLDI